MKVNLFTLASVGMLASVLFTTHVDAVESPKLTLKGQWITETDGQVMLNPQTSGLKHWRGKLLSISDGSAELSQSKQLHVIDPESAMLSPTVMGMTMSDTVKSSCFAEYLSHKPDFEALAVDPNNDKVIVIVTEDSRSVDGLSSSCAKRYKNSGSTDYPSLLVRLEVQDDDSVLMTHVRPLQFNPKFEVGNYPNDGIEGLAFGQNNTLYLALEKDSQTRARIFSLELTDDFWMSTEFAKVIDPQFLLPKYSKGNHPINGMDYLAVAGHAGFLVAAARNDSQLWIVDISKQQPTKVIDLAFVAPTGVTDGSCNVWDEIDNASLEGVGVIGNTIWMVNDPWKKHYMDNVICESNRDKYKKMAPLLFKTPFDTKWLSK